MGLDMYLEAELYVGGHYEHREAKGDITFTMKSLGGDVKEYSIPVTSLASISRHVGYWRKANAIHGWFVENVQSGTDECQRSYVSRDKLNDLLHLCYNEVESRGTKDAGSHLPPTPGFFFGSYEINEWYYQDITDTIKILEDALMLDDEWSFHYQASW